MHLTARHAHRYTALLAGLLLLALCVPLWEDLPWGEVLTDVVTAATLLAAVYASGRRRSYFLAILLATAALLSRILLAWRMPHAIALTLACWGLFLAYVTVVIVRDVNSTSKVDFDTISGALCGYLMLGLSWSVLYAACQWAHPGSLALAGAQSGRLSLSDVVRNYPLFVYYSFVTLTTTGYGDLSPVTMVTRSLSVIEAIAGQFYIAVLVARLVALEIVNSNPRPEPIDGR